MGRENLDRRRTVHAWKVLRRTVGLDFCGRQIPVDAQPIRDAQLALASVPQQQTATMAVPPRADQAARLKVRS